MRWRISNRFDPIALAIANRHYNRQKPDTPQFVPPGRCIVLLADDNSALWVSSCQAYAKHAYPGYWNNSIFRNEGQHLSSDLILEALAATRYLWKDDAPGMITFVAPESIRSTNPGYCYLIAGFDKLPDLTIRRRRMAFRMRLDRMPPPEPPLIGLVNSKYNIQIPA